MIQSSSHLISLFLLLFIHLFTFTRITLTLSVSLSHPSHTKKKAKNTNKHQQNGISLSRKQWPDGLGFVARRLGHLWQVPFSPSPHGQFAVSAAATPLNFVFCMSLLTNWLFAVLSLIGGQVSPEIAQKCMKTAFDLGINFFDTAEVTHITYTNTHDSFFTISILLLFTRPSHAHANRVSVIGLCGRTMRD